MRLRHAVPALLIAPALLLAGCGEDEPPAAPAAADSGLLEGEAGEAVDDLTEEGRGAGDPNQVATDTMVEVLGVTPAELGPGERLADLGADELDLMQLRMELEKNLFLSIPDAKWEAVVTVQDVLRVVRETVG